MIMVKTGDIVRFLNSSGGGKVVRITDNIAHVEDEDGFEIPVLVKECVVVGHADDNPSQCAEKPVVGPSPKPFAKEVPAPSVATVAPEEIPVEETPDGDRLNVVLGYEPHDLKRLSATTFDTYLVNDSNYYLYFAYLTRPDSSEGWTTRYAGIVEPNIQLFLEEIATGDLPQMDRVCLQYVAFKKDKEFSLKAPASVDFALDTTKFAKVHCFRDNIYFDVPVLAFDIVTNDAPFKAAVVNPRKMEDAMKAKIREDRRTKTRVVKKKQVNHQRRGETIVVDLHIGELVDSTRGLSNADMLNLQVDEFMRVMDENLKNKGQKIVFIHGKGEGVLRNAIMKELTHRYKGHDVQDASFREYGFGATQVTIK